MKSESAVRTTPGGRTAPASDRLPSNAHLEEMTIGIETVQRGAVVGLLNRLLADEYVLYTETRKCHWNVTGPTFHDLHKFFEAQYEELNTVVDDVAERIRALGGWPAATLAEFTKASRINERPDPILRAEQMLRNLLADHEQLIRGLRQDSEACVGHGDTGTNDFLIGLMEQHEKMAWMLRSCSEPNG
ncbi:MAG: Dps family protein [Thermoplasmata archaeon]